MKRQLQCIAMLLRMKLAHNMVFRLSFFGATFVDGIGFAVNLMLFSAIYANVGSIGGWSPAEMLVFVGTFSMINALNMVIYFFGINDLPGKIIRGDLDHYLTKPMNPLVRLTFENVDFGSLPLVALSAVLIARGVGQLDVTPTLGRSLGYALLVLVMTVLWYDGELVLRVTPFFFPSARRVDGLEELLVLCFKAPGTLFKGAYKFLLCFLLPYGVMSTLPTQWIAGTLSPRGYAYGVALTVGFTALALWLWRIGLRRYASASS